MAGGGPEIFLKLHSRLDLLSPSCAPSTFALRYRSKTRADLHLYRTSRSILFVISLLVASSVVTARTFNYLRASSLGLLRSTHGKVDRCVNDTLPKSCTVLYLGSGNTKRKGRRIERCTTSVYPSRQKKSQVRNSETMETSQETQTTRNLVFWENLVCGAVSRSGSFWNTPFLFLLQFSVHSSDFR